MAFTPIKCYGNYHRFCFLQKFNKRSRNSESHEKLPPAKSVMAWLILHFPGTYWNFYFAKAKLHHDGAVTFTGSVTSWKIKYYGKVTFASSRGCCCVISFEQQKNDGAFLAKFKKCYESRSQYEGGNCCCILSQKCKFTFDLLISQSLSMFWRCSRAATIAVGIWLETIADLFARFLNFCSMLFKLPAFSLGFEGEASVLKVVILNTERKATLCSWQYLGPPSYYIVSLLYLAKVMRNTARPNEILSSPKKC